MIGLRIPETLPNNLQGIWRGALALFDTSKRSCNCFAAIYLRAAEKNVPISIVSFEILAYLPDQSVWIEKGVSTLEHPTLSDHRAHMI